MSNSKPWIVVLTLAVALGGCSWFKSSSSKPYETSGESRPLEVPPDLDMPQTQSALSVPDRSEIAAAPATKRSDAPAPVELIIADTVEGALRRVALAIERSGSGRVVERNAALATIAVELPAEGGAGTVLNAVVRLETVEAERTRVRVTDESGNAIEDARAARLIEMLRLRLG